MCGAPLLQRLRRRDAWVSMVSISSMAAESRAAGVIQDFRFEKRALDQQQDLEHEIEPHWQ